MRIFKSHEVKRQEETARLNASMKRCGDVLSQLFDQTDVIAALRRNPNTQLTPDVNILDIYQMILQLSVFDKLEAENDFVFPGGERIHFSRSRSTSEVQERAGSSQNSVTLELFKDDEYFASLNLRELAQDDETYGIELFADYSLDLEGCQRVYNRVDVPDLLGVLNGEPRYIGVTSNRPIVVNEEFDMDYVDSVTIALATVVQSTGMQV